MEWGGFEIFTHEAIEEGVAFLVGGDLLDPNREVIGTVTEATVDSDGLRCTFKLNEKGSAWWRDIDSAPSVSYVVTSPERPQEAPGGHGRHDDDPSTQRGRTPRSDR